MTHQTERIREINRSYVIFSLLPTSLLEKATYSSTNGVTISSDLGFEFNNTTFPQFPSVECPDSDLLIKLPTTDKIRKRKWTNKDKLK